MSTPSSPLINSSMPLSLQPTSLLPSSSSPNLTSSSLSPPSNSFLSQSANSQLLLPPSKEAVKQMSPEELMKERASWLTEVFQENPQYLAMHERLLPIVGGYSLANIVHSSTVGSLASMNRFQLLELIQQHLQAIGMCSTAETLSSESGHQFQLVPQPWERTDLHLITSLAISQNEDPWESPPPPGGPHQYVTENIEEDFFSSPYRADPKQIWKEFADPLLNVVYSPADVVNYDTISRASLLQLINTLVRPQKPAASNKSITFEEFQELFFLTIHSITSAEHFLQLIIVLFDEADHEPSVKDANELRRNIANLLKKWLYFHGKFIGNHPLKVASQFCQRLLVQIQSDGKQKSLKAILTSLVDNIPNLTYGKRGGEYNPPNLEPCIDRPDVIFSPDLDIFMPDPTEVARQLCMLSYNVFKNIHSVEFIMALSIGKSTLQTPVLTDFLAFGRKFQHKILEKLIKSEKHDEAFSSSMKIAKQLLELKNFHLAACVLEVLKRADILALVSKKKIEEYKNEVELMWKNSGGNDTVETNHPTPYEKAINATWSAWEATIPNITLELAITYKEIKEAPDFIDGLINWEKRKALGEKACVFYRFQNQAYNFWPIPQIQNCILAEPDFSIKELEDELDLINGQ